MKTKIDDEDDDDNDDDNASLGREVSLQLTGTGNR